MSCKFERFGNFAAMGLLVTFAALPIFAVDSLFGQQAELLQEGAVV